MEEDTLGAQSFCTSIEKRPREDTVGRSPSPSQEEPHLALVMGAVIVNSVQNFSNIKDHQLSHWVVFAMEAKLTGLPSITAHSSVWSSLGLSTNSFRVLFSCGHYIISTCVLSVHS